MKIYNKKKLLLIAGPCSLENEVICRQVAEELSRIKTKHEALNIIFKGSYDKANRTSLKSPRGPGIEKGLEILSLIKNEYGFKTLTDVHAPNDVNTVADICDVIQIPAFLCRQTDILVAAAKSGKTVNIKKGQFLSPAEMQFVINKLEGSNAVEIWQTERGTTFGYQNLVVDMRSIQIMKAYGHPVIFDATHSVQLPGAGSGKTIGDRKFIPTLSSAALAAGANGIFVETHPNPDEAISDGANQVPLEKLEKFIENCLNVWSISKDKSFTL